MTGEEGAKKGLHVDASVSRPGAVSDYDGLRAPAAVSHCTRCSLTDYRTRRSSICARRGLDKKKEETTRVKN